MDATSDPPPTSLWLIETSSAGWNAEFSSSSGTLGFQTGAGSADDGIGDVTPTITYYPSQGPKLSERYSSDNPVSTEKPPAHWIQKSVVNGTLTLDRTFSAHASASVGKGGAVCAGCFWDGYTVSIHAQPYNFRSSSYTNASGTFRPAVVIDNPNATLSLSYIWSSTDGNLADLTSCTVNENVTWDTNTVGYFGMMPSPDGRKVYGPPSPPAGTDANGNPIGYLDPLVLGGPATKGAATDTFSPDSAYKGPYAAISWWGDQVYVFSDTDTGEVNTQIPGPASGSFRITRAFTATGTPVGTTGTLTISTRGNSAGPKALK